MMSMIAILQTPLPPDQEMGTALVITKMAGELARKIDTALTPTMGGNNPTGIGLSGYIYWLFIILITYGLFSLIWEAVNLVLDAGTEEHDHPFKRLADTGFIKRAFKFMILASLGIGSLFTIYKPDNSTFKPLGVKQTTAYINSTDNLGGRLSEMMNPINKIVAPMVNPPGYVDSTITGTIAKNSSKLGAYYIAMQSQSMASQAGASAAAETVWAYYHPDGSTTAASLPEGSSWISSAADTVVGWFNAAASYIVASWSAFFLLWMNFGLDVLVVKTLVFNAIYLMMAYKIAVMILPVAFVAAYWHQWEGVLKGVIQTMIVTTISLNVLADTTAILVSPEQITDIITTAQVQAQSKDAKAAMEVYAKKVYADMVNSQGAAAVTKEAFTAKVVNLMGDPETSRVFNFDTLFFVPLRVLMMFSILLVLIGKIGTVISDTISGTMSYHR